MPSEGSEASGHAMTPPTLAGRFDHIVYSPHGAVEGLLLSTEGGVVQVVLDKEDAKGAALVATLRAGQAIALLADALPPSKKGPGAHAVRAFRKLVSVDGERPPKATPSATGYSGAIVRLNYARHGAPNGYVLDSGDFIHVKPEGFTRLKLKVGDKVVAEGDAHFLSTGGGWAVEATRVNGKSMK